MVLSESKHVAYWSSVTSPSGPAVRVQDDGNLVLHSGGTVMGPVAWNTQTHYP